MRTKVKPTALSACSIMRGSYPMAVSMDDDDDARGGLFLPSLASKTAFPRGVSQRGQTKTSFEWRRVQQRQCQSFMARKSSGIDDGETPALRKASYKRSGSFIEKPKFGLLPLEFIFVSTPPNVYGRVLLIPFETGRGFEKQVGASLYFSHFRSHSDIHLQILNIHNPSNIIKVYSNVHTPIQIFTTRLQAEQYIAKW